MLSRVAESIYWMNRYIERAENVARFVDVNLHLLLDLPNVEGEQWAPMVYTTGDFDSFTAKYGKASREKVIQFLAFDGENPNSILSCLRAARENARSVREIIPSEMWEQVNTFYWMVFGAAHDSKVLEFPHDFFTKVKMESHLYVGLTVTCMSHNEGWHFCRLGRLLERADKTTRILDVKYFMLLPSAADVGSTLDSIQWSALLRSASAWEAYRKRYGRIAPDKVVQFLLLDREFPRAVLYCLIRTEDSLHAISHSPEGTFANRAERRCGQVVADLSYADAGDVIARGLHQFLDSFQARLNEIGDAVFETYFAMHPLHPGAA